MILRLVLMMSIYWLIMSPLTYIAGVPQANVTSVNTVITESMTELEKARQISLLTLPSIVTTAAKHITSDLSFSDLIFFQNQLYEDIGWFYTQKNGQD